MTEHNQLIARNVKRFRQEQGLTKVDLAHRAGIAKQTLLTVEQGLGNPTVETLALLADALDVSLRRLLTEWGTPVFVRRAHDAEWTSHPRWDELVFDEVYGSGYVRTLLMRLRGDARQGDDEPLSPGTLRHLYVMTGRIEAGPAAELVELGPGDFARIPADVPHRISALTPEATVFVVSTEPQLRQGRPRDGRFE